MSKLKSLLERSVSASPSLCYIVHDAGFFVSHRLALAVAARREGYDVTVICPTSLKVEAILAEGLHHLPVSLSRGVAGPLPAIRLFLEYFRHLRKRRPDIVHLVTSKPIILGGIAARILRIPTVAAVSGLGFVFTNSSNFVLFLRKLVKIGYDMATNRANCHVIFQNKDDQAAFARMGLLRFPTYSLIDGSGVDLDRFQWSPERKGPIAILLPARMLRDKGVGEFIEAARIIRSRGLDARFRLQGKIDTANPNGITQDELTATASAAGVEWHEHTDAIEQVLSESHIVTLPSYYGEGLPKTIIDAAAAGRPVVTTDWPGCRDAIEPGITGLLVRPRDAADLADRLEELIRAPERRVAMGLAARKFAEEKFDIRKVVAAHLAIYRDVYPRRR